MRRRGGQTASETGLGICFGPASGLSVRQLIPLAKQAETVGFTSVWTGEFGNDCLAWIQAFASATEDCRIGSSIVNVYLRHPVVVAAAAAAVDELSGSRLVLGLGTSHRSIVEDALGLTMNQPLDYLEEYVQVVRAVLDGEPVCHHGTCFNIDGYRLGATVARSDLPVYVATLGLVAAERAGRYADGVLLTLTPPDYEYTLVEKLRDGAMLAQRDPENIEVVQILPYFVSDDVGAAEMAARRMICRYAALPFYGDMFVRAGFRREVAGITEALAAGEDQRAWSAVSTPMLEALAAIGDVTACQGTIDRHLEAGADSVVLYPNAVTSDTSEAWSTAIDLTLDRCAGALHGPGALHSQGGRL